MHDFPHRYKVAAAAGPQGEVSLSGERLETILSAPPAQFGGPGNRWSPEALLVAAVADCFVLSFRAIAGASRLAWASLQCEAEGTLDRVDGRMQFSGFALQVVLQVPHDTDEPRARRLLEKAEQSCLITNSLSGETHLHAVVNKLS